MHNQLPPSLEQALEIRSMKLDLERMKRFDAALGHPSRGFPSVHIAGTNGKGSVATKIAKGFPRKKVGLFTSPHIHSFTERIQINGAQISEEKAHALMEWIVKTIETPPSYFELLTLLAFTYFAEEEVDLAVLEVGMGGRLDATNIVTPLLSVITSIGLDHMRYLGNTLEAIAYEKGGVIKPGIPVVVGPTARYYPGAIEVTGSFTDYDKENQAIARAALEELGGEFCGLSDTPPCRFERIGPYILDVAHNPAALERTFERMVGERVRALVAFSADKDISACLKVIERHAVAYHLVTIDHPRAFVPEVPLKIEEALGFVRPGESVLITGTFFMMAEARAIIERELASD
ncbi:MAG: Folylpolyglutamate synthase [Chlamydiales bacterium]|nr:Folylpolyglutamate synthase [Chlamydiales bacterium]